MAETGLAGLRLGGVFAICAAAVGLFALIDGKTMAEALLVGLSAGFLLPPVAAVLMFVVVYLVDLVAGLIASAFMLTWIAFDWRNRVQIIDCVQAVERRWARTIADRIIARLCWLVGKKA